jgi:NAD(P)-dependent dehydrogenase (short-subunit alcohol dehydrogenase family)
MGCMQDKVVVITGAASGMGLAGAKLFAAEGAKVAAIDIAEDKLRAVVDAITADGGTALPLAMDITSEAAWQKAIAQVVDAFGGVDVLVNDAGIVTTHNAEETDEDEWDRVLSVNAKGPWLGTKYVVPELRKAGGGAIVNVASIAGLVGGKGSLAYSSSKGALRAMTKSVADAYAGEGIRANAILPGLVYTGMTGADGAMSKEEAGRTVGAGTPLPPHCGDAEDIAQGMLYLASDASKFVTGAEIVIDGGWTVS